MSYIRIRGETVVREGRSIAGCKGKQANLARGESSLSVEVVNRSRLVAPMIDLWTVGEGG